MPGGPLCLNTSTQANEGILLDPDELDLFRTFLSNTVKSSDTIRLRVGLVKVLLRECVPLTRITFDQFLERKKHELEEIRKKQVNPAACHNKYIQTLKSFANFRSVYYDDDQYMWAMNVRQKTEDTKVPSLLSATEAIALITLPQKENQSEENFRKWRLFWALAWLTGMRLKELRKLSIDDIDFGQRAILVDRTKTGEERYFPYQDILEKPLQERMREINGYFLFPSMFDPNKPMSYKAVEKNFHEAISRLGIKRKVRPYIFRNVAINKWLKKLKMPLYDVKSLAGHRQTRTTERYYVLGDLEEIREQLNDDPDLQDAQPPERVVTVVEKYIFEKMKSDPRFNQALIRQAMGLLWESIKPGLTYDPKESRVNFFK